jgi:hypothetical protein
MVREDCIYFSHHDADANYLCECYECSRRGTLVPVEKGDMCNLCRIWDFYIPNNTPQDKIDYAEAWDGENYEDYFKNV